MSFIFVEHHSNVVLTIKISKIIIIKELVLLSEISEMKPYNTILLFFLKPTCVLSTRVSSLLVKGVQKTSFSECVIYSSNTT